MSGSDPVKLPIDLPPSIRQLLQDEEAAGNSVVSVTSTYPAPPIGYSILLSRAITTRPRKTESGLRYRFSGNSLYASFYCDLEERVFVLEPPLPPPEEPNMDEIRERSRSSQRPVLSPPSSTAPYEIQLDHRGEWITYSEPERRTGLACSFDRKVILHAETLGDWWYPESRKIQPLSPPERATVLDRIVSYCRTHQGISKIEIDGDPSRPN